MIQRELSYHVPFERLEKLSRSTIRKASPAWWLLFWFLFAAFFIAGLAYFVLGEVLREQLEAAGAPAFGLEVLFLLVCLLLFAGMWVLRRLDAADLKRRADFDETVRLRQDEGCLRIATTEIEYYLKWQGISQMLVERDGVVVSHGALFFLIPDAAFASPVERIAFIRDVYGRLNERARSLSKKHVRAALRDG